MRAVIVASGRLSHAARDRAPAPARPADCRRRRASAILLLDEPTDHLDVNTVRASESGLEQFAGTVVVISHDRSLPDRVATHILAFEGECRVTYFDGNFSEYEDWRRSTLGEAALRPHRITYRKLTR